MVQSYTGGEALDRHHRELRAAILAHYPAISAAATVHPGRSPGSPRGHVEGFAAWPSEPGLPAFPLP
jgi:hypothetical protein